MSEKKLKKEDIDRLMDAKWLPVNHQVTRWVVDALAADGLLHGRRVMAFIKKKEREKKHNAA